VTQNKLAIQLEQHLRRFFVGHSVEYRRLDRGPIANRLAEFSVAVISPGPKTSLWAYVTSGASAIEREGHRNEFLFLALRYDDRWVELATMTAYYHAGPEAQRFGVGHTVPQGEPVVEGSSCETLLFSLPYPLGPEFERCEFSDGTHLQILWVLPITAREKTYKSEHGLEALEKKFEQNHLEYWDLTRQSVV
jgi:Suppressor of fused protein (SUFU)